MILKKLLLNKYNIYFILLFFIISISGSVYLYKNKELHNYSYVYKVQLPNLTRLNKIVGIGTMQIPIMTFYQFHNYVKNHQGIIINCPNFDRNVRLSIWEARNEIDWRFEIKYSNPKYIDQCINQIIEAIEESRNTEILKVKNLNEFEATIFEDSVKEVIDNNDFKKFRDFVKKEAKGLENLDDEENASEYKSDEDFNEMAELLAGVLKLGTLNINEKLSTPKFSDNFLTGYIYNFLESYKSLKYISSLTETKVEKISEQYFLKKNILKFNLAVLFLLIILLILINIKDLKKLF